MNKINRLPLHEFHLQNSAKMTSFAGWEMPVSYGSSVKEHMKVRDDVGFFDVSHMGEIVITGPQSLEFLNYVTTNDLEKITDGQAIYSLMCNERGGVIDDLIIYRVTSTEFFICVNASNAQVDLLHLIELSNSFDCSVQDVSSEYGLIAIQGRNSGKFLKENFKKDFAKINRMHFSKLNFWEKECIVARTGYTGEDGYEIFLPVEIVEKFARSLSSSNLKNNSWIGLAARDSLRLEAGFPLHGHEISEDISPLQARLMWAVAFDKGGFVGKEILEKQKISGGYSKVFHYEVEDRRIPRNGASVICGDKPAGFILSGGYSPLIEAPIGTALIEKDFLDYVGTGKWYAEVRGKLLPIKFSKPVMKRHG